MVSTFPFPVLTWAHSAETALLSTLHLDKPSFSLASTWHSWSLLPFFRILWSDHPLNPAWSVSPQSFSLFWLYYMVSSSLNSQICISSPGLSSELHTWIFSRLLDTSTLMLNRHLNLSLDARNQALDDLTSTTSFLLSAKAKPLSPAGVVLSLTFHPQPSHKSYQIYF